MKTESVKKIRAFIKNKEWHNYLVILPTPALVERFIDLLFNEDIKGTLYPKIYTFDQFIGEVLGGSNNYINDISKKEILKNVIFNLNKEGQLNYIRGRLRYGIIDYIAEAISELKQYAIKADKFYEVAKSLDNHRISDLALIYKSYEEELRANGLRDQEDRFLDVLNKLENEDIPLLKDVKYLYSEWFIDNTMVQHQIFMALEKIIPDSDLSLSIYGKTKIDDLACLYPTDKNHLANLIYSDESNQVLSPEIAVFSEGGKEGEVKKVLHEVIRLLEDNVPASDIAIVARNPQEYVDILLKWFDKVDVPLEIEVKKPLISSQVIKSLFLWLELAENYRQNPFPLDTLLGNYYLVDDFEGEKEVLKWCKSQGEHTIHKWLDLWQTSQEELVLSLGRDAYDKVLQILETVLDLWASLVNEGFTRDIISSIKYNLDKLNIEKRIQKFSNNISIRERVAISYRENQAFSSFIDLINNLEQIWTSTNRTNSLSNVLNDIKEYLTNLNYSYSKNYRKGIKVLSPTEIRGLKFHSVFLLGMEQNEFPKLVLQNPLLRDNDRINMRRFFYLPLSNEVYEREKLLFFLVIQASEKELFLTYSATDEDGESNLASLFIEDVLNLIAKDQLLEPYMPKMMEVLPSSQLTHLLRVEAMRNSESFSVYEGCFEDEALLDKLKSKTYQKKFSISTLNYYANCPMRYFMIAELGLVDSIEVKEGIPRTELGSIKHEVLAQVLPSYEDLDVNNLLSIVSKVLEEVCQEKGFIGEEYPNQWLWELEKRNIAKSLSNLIETELQRSSLKPSLFEWRFGYGDKPFYLEIDNQKIPIRGVIDRIDKDEENHFAVYDYKESVSVGRKDIEGARELQLPIYIMAVENLLGEVVGTSYIEIKESKPAQAFYKKDYKQQLGFGSLRAGEYLASEWENWLEDIKLQVGNYIKNIANAQFPAIPHNCKYCHLEDICLYKPSRIRLKRLGGE